MIEPTRTPRRSPGRFFAELRESIELQPLLVPVYAIVLALLVASVVILIVGGNPLEAYWALLRGMFGSPDRIAASLGRSTPFIGAALAVAFAFRAGLFNIGAEGQLLVGATTAAWVGTLSWLADVPGPIAIPIVILAGALGGAIWGGIPGVLKAKTGAHEVIVTIMLNNIAILGVRWLVNSQDPLILRDAGASVARTKPLPESVRLPELISTTPPVHLGFLLAISLCVVVWFVLKRTTFGFEVRTVGANPHAAKYAGMGVGRTIIVVMVLSGAFAGIAGAGEITGTQGFLSPGVFVGIGFDAIAIALLARANPFGIILTSILWGSMLSGAGLMQQEAGLSIDAVRIIQALVLLFVAADVIVRTLFRIRAAEGHGLDTTHVSGLGGADVNRLKFGRRQTIGVIFGLVGLYLVGYVAPNLDPTDREIAFEPPPDPAEFTIDPSVVVTAIGFVFILCAIATFFERRSERVARVALITASVLFVPLVIVVALALSQSTSTNVMQLLVESLRLSTPIALGAMAGLWCERSGVVNIGIEGMMLTSACTAFLAYVKLGDAQDSWALWAAVGIALLTGGLIALLLALLAVSFRVDQIIAGVVINLLALGLTGFLRSEVLVDTGISTGVPIPAIGLPLLSDLPIVGEQLFTNKPIFFAMFVVIAVTSWVLHRTAFGLRVRSVGEHPHAAETVGIDPLRIRYRAVLIGGLIAGLAGAWFSLESQSGFQDNMTNGAGFIALAALIFGRWQPWTAFAGAILFGFTRALGARLQILQVTIGDFSIPSEFLQALPYVVTIIVVAGAVGRAIPPAADGVPYERSR